VRKQPKLRLVGKGGDTGGASIFDDMDKLRANLAAAGGVPDASANDDTPTVRPAKAKETFAPIPHDYAVELYRHNVNGAAWAVLIELHRIIFAARGKNPVRFWSPRLRAVGLNSRVRTRALRQLEAAGMIEVEWRGRGLSPRVRHLRYRRQE